MHYKKSILRKLFGKPELPAINLSRKDILIKARTLAGKLSISGVQPKLSLALVKNELLAVKTKGQFILKPQNDIFEHLPENETLCMSIAKKTGMNVPPNILITLNDKSTAFLIKRFDRLSYNRKLHMEDFSQILEKNKYDGSYEQIGNYIKSHKKLGLLQVQYFFERVLLNYVIGNADAHLKNFSILLNEKGKYILSPAYDLVSSNLAIPEEKEETALSLAGKKRNFKRRDFVEFGKTIGVKEPYINKCLQKYINAKKTMYQLTDESMLSEFEKDRFKNIVQKRVKQFQDI